MRRTFLKLSLGSIAAIPSLTAFACEQSPIADKRLLGKWVCDKERTIASIKASGKSADPTLYERRFNTYEETQVLKEIGGTLKLKRPYKVVATDSQSVVIEETIRGQNFLWHIVFETDRSMYYTDGLGFLFFTKVGNV